MIIITLLISLFLVSVLYSSVGHGGASGYIAVFVLFNFSQTEMKTDALMLNIVVSAIALFQFFDLKTFPKKPTLYLLLGSIPSAFLGGILSINIIVYKILLGVFLTFSIYKLIRNKIHQPIVQEEIKLRCYILIGSVVGFLSGLIGVGGGILLTPILLLLNWQNMHQIAMVSALFILVNSIAGLTGNLFNNITISEHIVQYIVVVIVGGFLGAFLGSKKFDTIILKRILAFVLTIALVKLWL